jgi:hypothetical protein
VHELAHVWDMRKGLQLSNGLMQATGSLYRVTCVLPPDPFRVIEEYTPGARWLKGRIPPANPLEDWADSVASYVYRHYAHLIPPPYRPARISPTRWSYARDHMQVKLWYPIDWVRCFCDLKELPPGLRLPACH